MKTNDTTLQSHPDLPQKGPRTLLIGYGWVGRYCGTYFTNHDIYDVNGYSGERQHDHYDLGIISVPTPMDPETGACDVHIVEESVARFKDDVDYFMIKSTVEIGTTDRLAQKYDVKIVFSPEYLGETIGHPLNEPHQDAFQIIGGERATAEKIAEFWEFVLNANAPLLCISAQEAEIVKYCENYWVMRQVDYWNDVYDVCQAFEANFFNVREGLVMDPRHGRTHSFVYPDNRGWSGKCLPKDNNALYKAAHDKGLELSTVRHLILKNARHWRKDYDNHERLVSEELEKDTAKES